jgi:dihydrofolate reductase
MGRKTYESIGKPLPGRTMVVVTDTKSFHPEGCVVVNSIDTAIRLAERNHETEIFIIGGGQIFSQSLDRADKIYLTKVHTISNAEVFFPHIDPSIFLLVSSEETIKNEKDEYKSTFQILLRKKPGMEN